MSEQTMSNNVCDQVCPVVAESETKEVDAGVCLTSGYGEWLGDEFQRLNSQPVLSKAHLQSHGVRLCDEFEDLELYCYDNDSDVTSDPFLQQCRGVVFKGDKVVSRAFSYTFDFNAETQAETIKEHLNEIFEQCKFYTSYEGALVRVFYLNDRWFVSTHRKFDANKSKWGSATSFGALFTRALNHLVTTGQLKIDQNKDIVDGFCELLDTTKQYVFLVCNDKTNRIACVPPEHPTVYHVGTFDSNSILTTNDRDIGVPTPQEHKFTDVDELLAYVAKVDPFQYQGVVVFLPNNTQIKIYSNEYHNLFYLRGNVSSVPFRYLELRNTTALPNFVALYPEFHDKFKEYEHLLYVVATYLHESYIKRFAKRQQVTVEPFYFSVISKVHTDYKERMAKYVEGGSNGPKPNVTVEIVYNILCQQKPSHLNKMIRDMSQRTRGN